MVKIVGEIVGYRDSVIDGLLVCCNVCPDEFVVGDIVRILECVSVGCVDNAVGQSDGDIDGFNIGDVDGIFVWL